MKLLDIDWADFIERLTEWERLSPTARKAFAELKSNQGKEVTDFDGYAPVLAAAGFLAYYADGRRVKLCKDCSPFARAVRAMVRNGVFGSPNEETLRNYLRENFTANLPRSATGVGHKAQRAAGANWTCPLFSFQLVTSDFISSSSFQQTSCIRGRWNGPFQRLPFSRTETRPSRCR